MIRVRGICTSGTVVVALLATALPARAELYQNVARGLALLDFQFSGERNVLGDGITVNADAFYNNRSFDFGVAQLTLNGGLSASAGFTRRGIPGANFSLDTRGSTLGYNFQLNNGIQDFTATGNALINVQTNVNVLGFYDRTIQVSNRGSFEGDGLSSGSGTLDFDLGPINTSGNLYIDVLATVTQPLFEASGRENFFAKLSAQATKIVGATKSMENLQARAAAGEILTDAEIAELVNNSIIAAVLGGQPSGSVFEQLAAAESGFDAAVPVPEPAILTPLTVLLASGLMRRRRSR